MNAINTRNKATVRPQQTGGAALADPVSPVTISINLPWPPSELHPNARVHWAKKAKITKRCRQFAWAKTLTLSIADRRRGADASRSLTVTAVFCPPDARRRDTDGMLSACKAYFDGIADALGVDDSRWQLSLRREAPVKNGLVRIELGAA